MNRKLPMSTIQKIRDLYCNEGSIVNWRGTVAPNLGRAPSVCYTAVTMQRYKTLLLSLLAGVCTGQLAAEVAVVYDNDKPFPPHKVVGNIYFVGREGLGSFLITTPHGPRLIYTES